MSENPDKFTHTKKRPRIENNSAESHKRSKDLMTLNNKKNKNVEEEHIDVIESFPSSLEYEEYLDANSESTDTTTNLKETKNLLKAYWHLKTEVSKLPSAKML